MSNTIIVHRTGQAPLRVRGEVIASSGTSSDNASSSYSGSPGRSMAVEVIKTATAQYVVSIHYSTCWQGEHDTDEAVVFPSLTQAIDYLGDIPGWLLSEIIEEIGDEAVAEEVA